MDSERKQYSEEKKQKERKIKELEEEILKFKLSSPVAAKKIQNESSKPQNSSSSTYSNNFHQAHRTDTFNLFYTVPHNFFSFLFPSSTHVMHAPVLNV